MLYDTDYMILLYDTDYMILWIQKGTRHQDVKGSAATARTEGVQ